MGDHFQLDVDASQVASAGRRLGELGDHLGKQGHTVSSAPGRWADGWHGKASTAVGQEATVLGGHLTSFGGHFHHAGSVIAEFAHDLDTAATVDVPDLNRRWDAADAAYRHAVHQAQTRFDHSTSGIDTSLTPQVRKMIKVDLADGRDSATSSASSARSSAQHKLELEYDDLCDRLRRHAQRVSTALSAAVAVPVPAALVAAYQAAQGNTFGRVLWGLGGNFLADLTTGATTALGGPMEKLQQQLANPPQDYAQLTSLLAQARGLGVPPAQFAPTLKMYWQYRAAEAAGIDLSTWDPSKGADHNADTIEKVYRYYGNLYLSNPNLQWAGMANMIGPSFAAGFFDINEFKRFAENVTDLPGPLEHALPPGVEDLANLPENELRFYETTFLDMQKQIFLDQGSMHQAYADGGMPAVKEMQEAGLIDQATLDGWTDIDSGDPSRVQRGNETFLLREQRDIIDDDYQKMYHHSPTGPAMTWAMTQIGEPSIPDAKGYADVFPLHVGVDTPGPRTLGTPHSIFGHEIPHVSVDDPAQVHIDVTTPFASGNIANFDDRWALIQQDTLPKFQHLLATDPQRARDIIASDVHTRIGDYRLSERVDDILGQLTHWDVDVDQ